MDRDHNVHRMEVILQKDAVSVFSYMKLLHSKYESVKFYCHVQINRVATFTHNDILWLLSFT